LIRNISVAGTVSLLLLLTICIVAGGTPAFAGDRVFTLQQAVAFSLQHNGDLKALREEKGVREAGKIKAGLYPNPALGLEGTTGNLSGSPYENRISVVISQEFLTMGKRGKRLQVADKELEAFERQIENFGRLLAEDVKAAFYNLSLAKKRMELAERSIVLNKQLLTITKQRFEADDIPELDMNLAKVELARSEGKKVEWEREVHLIKAKLLALMGFPQDEVAAFRPEPETNPLTKSLEELRSMALSKRPDIKALEAEKEKEDFALDLAKAEAIPNITAGLGYQRETKSLEVAGNDVKGQDNLIALRFSVPIPLFDRNQAGVQEAQSKKRSIVNRLIYARQVVERKVEAGYARLTTADRALAIYSRDIMPQLEENLKLVQEAYRLGEVGILSVIEEQKKFYEVNDAYLFTLYNRQSAMSELEAAVGVEFKTETNGGVR